MYMVGPWMPYSAMLSCSWQQHLVEASWPPCMGMARS